MSVMRTLTRPIMIPLPTIDRTAAQFRATEIRSARAREAARGAVLQAFRSTKTQWLATVTEAQRAAIRSTLNIDPATFWQACKGQRILDLPPELRQGDLFAETE